jgi:hypothetical protein
MAWTDPETAVAGEVLTAAWLNTNVRDNQNMQGVGAWAYRSTNQTSYANGATIIFDAENYATDGMFTAGGTAITTVEPGIYTILFSGLIQAATSVTNVQAIVNKNGTDHLGAGFPGVGTVYGRFCVSGTVKAAANDTWSAELNATASGSLTILGNANPDAINCVRLVMQWIGPG